MSKKRKPKKDAGSAAAPPIQRSWSRALIFITLAAVVTLAFIWHGKTRPPAPPPPAAEPPRVETTNALAVVPATGSEFQKLKGRWLRPDGGYIVEIRGVEATGKLDATYSNPRPINVSRAEAAQEGAFTRVFIELRDGNYPGSTYTLTYDPQSDQLRGIYFQAVMKQQFEVAFERLK